MIYTGGMSYKGDIIEESLADKATLEDVNIIATRIEAVTRDHKTPWLKQWTLYTIEVPEGEAAAIAEKLSHAILRTTPPILLSFQAKYLA